MSKTNAIQKIEERMEGMDPRSLRYAALEAAKNFKSSWMDLGRKLYAVQRDKLFREWGYLTFEAYCVKEIGVRKETAAKLLRSYFFLESEEPSFLKRHLDEEKPARIPTYESVNVLRLAKASRKIPEADYQRLREDVLEEAKPEAEVRKKVRYLLRSDGFQPASSGQGEDKRFQALRKLAAHLKSTESEAEKLGLPDRVVRQIRDLVRSLEQNLRGSGDESG
ncbi:MAG: hypothetical protein HY593_05150 [Candidatus Omnitrophica bacterium]|nr:hypothetical protein [Candidatus Omnitrophota bacterium]